MAWRVQKLDFDRACFNLVAGIVSDEILFLDARHLRHAVRFGAMDMDRTRIDLEQVGQPLDAEAEDRPADVVGMIVRGQCADHAHAVGLRHLDDPPYVPRRVDDQAFAGVAIADQINEVLHLLGGKLPLRNVAAHQQLAQVELGHRPPV